MDSEEFKRLEEDYRFLSHARERLGPRSSEIESGSYIVVDIETTGLDPVKNEIIEIGALKVESGEVKDILHKLVMPAEKLPEEITRLTGITEEMLAGSPGIAEALPDFLSFAGGATLVAHNADFDITFIREKLKEHLKRDLGNRSICTVKVSRALFPNLENHKLHTIANYLKVPISGRHRAIGDAEATLQIWLIMVKKLKERGINTLDALEKLINQTLGAKAPF